MNVTYWKNSSIIASPRPGEKEKVVALGVRNLTHVKTLEGKMENWKYGYGWVQPCYS